MVAPPALPGGSEDPALLEAWIWLWNTEAGRPFAEYLLEEGIPVEWVEGASGRALVCVNERCTYPPRRATGYIRYPGSANAAAGIRPGGDPGPRSLSPETALRRSARLALRGALCLPVAGRGHGGTRRRGGGREKTEMAGLRHIARLKRAALVFGAIVALAGCTEGAGTPSPAATPFL